MANKQSFIEILNEQLESENTSLPAFDKTAYRVQKEAAREDPDARLIEKLITNDQALTGQLLRVANSSFYKGLVKVSTVRNAILRLGLNEVSNIVTMVTQEKNYNSKDPFFNAIMRKLWRHSLGCAMGAFWISRQTGFQALSHEAFFAGLLHDVGKLFIITVIDNIKRNNKLEKPPSEGLLYEAMASLHSENGHRLMQHWNLPEQYCAVARNHHTDDFDPKDFILLMVRVANCACNKIGIGIKNENDISLAALAESKLLDLSDVDLAKLEIHLEDTKIIEN